MVNTLDPDTLAWAPALSNLDEIYEDLPPVLASSTFLLPSRHRSARLSRANRATSAVPHGAGRTHDAGPEAVQRPIRDRLAAAFTIVDVVDGMKPFIGHVAVACGRLIGYVEPHTNSWDSLGAVAVIEGVGGRCK